MPTHTDYQPVVATLDTTIANGAAASAAIDLAGTTLCGIHLPAAFTGASLSFTAAPTLGGTYQTLQRNGADLSVTVAQGKYISLTAGDFIGVQFLKIVSGSNEAATRTLTLAVRPV